MPKISIVIPVYNTALYLEQCLDSVLEQTLHDIEVICVDDCSRDASYQIMREYNARDSRVKIFRFEESKSALQARKTGVMAAEGEYIMFLDADDYLELNACEILYEKAKKENVDILHFSSRVVNCANLPEGRIQHNEKLIRPCTERIEGDQVFDACFREKKYFIQLWNKVFRADVCKKAFADMVDRYLPKAQDLYSFFIIAYYAKSYLGWESEPLHNYCFGRGVTGSSAMNLDKFERYCTQANIVAELENFCAEKNILEKNREVVHRYYEQWITECIKIWYNELPKEYAVKGWEILYRYWGCKQTLTYFAKTFWLQRRDISRKLNGFPQIPLKDKKVKTIAFYYIHYTIGGVQRVISLLAPMFIKQGYKVVIITDSEPAEGDFELPEGAVRATIKSRDAVNRDNFALRLDSWDELMKEYQFDVVLYNAWVSNVMMWDALYLKNAGIPVVLHAHNVFSFSVNKFGSLFAEIVNTFNLTDGMVVLSEADKVFWDAYNRNVHYIPNPVSHDLLEAKHAKWENKALIWVARVSDEKQPWAVFDVMKKVAAQVPDAKLYLLGNFESENWHNLARKNGIEDNIEFCGLIPNVNDYYEKSSVFISTSKYEGFPMTLIEAQAHSLPTVMFHMPHLTMGTAERGVIGVDMMDCTSAANEIVKLLKDETHWNAVSALAKDSYEQLIRCDLERAWDQVLHGEPAKSAISPQVQNMIHTFVNHYEEGFKFQTRRQAEMDKKLKANLELVQDPVSYRIGRFVTFIPRKIKGGIQCCKDHGIAYTIKLAFSKIKKLFK